MRYKDIPWVPFVYVKAKILPGLLAIPTSEIEAKKKEKRAAKRMAKKKAC